MECELSRADKELERLAGRKGKLMDSVEFDAVDQDALTARLSALVAEESSLHARRSEIAFELDCGGLRSEVSFDEVRCVLPRLDELLEHSSRSRKRLSSI